MLDGMRNVAPTMNVTVKHFVLSVARAGLYEYEALVVPHPRV